jgi:hypothetical protein
LTTLNEVGRVVDVLPVRATTDLVAVNEVGRPIDVPLATIEAGLISTNEVGGAVSVTPVRIVTDPFVPDAAGRLVFAQPLRGLVVGNPPVNTVLPVISQTGSVLSVTTGTWTGTAPITYAYQWSRNGTPISGATASTYTIPDADLNALFGCIVTATNSAGNASAAAALLYVGVMDVLSVQPAVNYELRRESRSYTGNAMRVRRSSDNAEANIGFTANGDLDTTALLAHVGSQNLLLRSQEFENGVWEGLAGSAETIAANSEIAPDGTLTAERCTVLSSTSGRYQTITLAAAGQVTCSVFIKAGSTGTWARIGFFDTAVVTNQARCWVNMLTGAIGTVSTIGSGWSGATASSTPVGNGWYRISLTATSTVTAISVINTAADADNSTNRTIGQNRIIWGAQLNTGATAQPYYATTNVVRTGDGFITILHDKSGNGRNATQTTPANQPQIVSNGAIITQGGRPALRFDGVNDYLAAASPLIGTTHSLFILFTPTIENEFGTVFGQWSSGQNGRFYVIANQESAGPISAGRLNVANTTATGGNGTNGAAADVAISNTLTLITSISTTGSEQWKLFKNGAEWDSATITSVFTGVNSAIGSLNGLGSSLPFDGTFSGLTSFPSVLSTDRQLIERNRGAYYGIPVS